MLSLQAPSFSSAGVLPQSLASIDVSSPDVQTKPEPSFGNNGLLDSFSNGAGVGTGAILALGGLALILSVAGEGLETTKNLVKSAYASATGFLKPQKADPTVDISTFES